MLPVRSKTNKGIPYNVWDCYNVEMMEILLIFISVASKAGIWIIHDQSKLGLFCAEWNISNGCYVSTYLEWGLPKSFYLTAVGLNLAGTTRLCDKVSSLSIIRSCTYIISFISKLSPSSKLSWASFALNETLVLDTICYVSTYLDWPKFFCLSAVESETTGLCVIK